MTLPILKRFKSLSVLGRAGACFGVAAAGCLIVNSWVSGLAVSQQPQQFQQPASGQQVQQLLENATDFQQLRQQDGKVRSASSVDQLFGGTKQITPSSSTIQARVIQPRAQAVPAESTWAFPQGESSALLQRASFNSQGTESSQVQRPVYQQTLAPQVQQTIPRQIQTDATAFGTSGRPLRAGLPADTISSLPASNQFQLKNQDWKGFEASLMSIWGSKLEVRTEQQGRMVHIGIPLAGGKNIPMTLDRLNNKVQFNGPASANENWQTLMRQLDQPAKRDTSVQTLVSVPAGKTKIIRQTALLALQEQVPAAGQEDNGPRIVRQEGGKTVIQGGELKGPVEVTFLDDGRVLLSGDPEDVKIVEQVIDSLIESADTSQPVQKRIDLKNGVASVLAPALQDIYDNQFQSRFGSATIQAVPGANSLYVLGSQTAVENIEKLVELNDPASAEGAEAKAGFAPYKLKHISAVDAQTRINQFFGQSNANNVADPTLNPPSPVTTIVDFRSNTLLVKASPQFQSQVAKIIEALDVSKGEGATDELRVIKLRNALAEELAPIVQDALNGQLENAGRTLVQSQAAGGGGGGNANAAQPVQASPTNSQLRSRMLQFMNRDGSFSSGFTFDVRVTPDRNSNSVIVSASEDTMPLVVALINELDRIPDAESLVKVFPVIHGDASTILTTLQTLFSGANQGGAAAGAQAGGTSTLPLQSFSAGDGASLINLRFSVEPRSNAIIASGPAGDLQVIDDLILRLDQAPDSNTLRRTYVYRLSNSAALDVEAALTAYLDDRFTIESAAFPATNPGGQNQSDVIVVAEAVSNSLIINASPNYYPELQRVIERLDRRPPMVKVKVLIAEVDLSTLEELGVEVGIQDSLLFDRGLGDATPVGFPFNTAALGNATDAVSLATRESLAGQALSNLGTGRINSELGFGGLVLSAGNESINVLLRALKDKQCLKVLSKPHIMTIENSQGRVQIGARVPRVTGSNVTNNGILQNEIEDVAVGIILEITPRVTPDGLVIMDVDATKSSLGDALSGVVVAIGADGSPIMSPQILETSAQTTIMARHGQTVVFSGLVQEEKSTFKRGAPILSDLPVIGPLFSFEGDAASRSELMIILTPYIVTGDEDIDMVNRDEMDRMHWCLCDVAEVYGNSDYQGFQDPQEPTEVYYPDSDPSGSRPMYNEPNPVTAPVPNSQQSQPNQPALDNASLSRPATTPAEARPSRFRMVDSLRRAKENLTQSRTGTRNAGAIQTNVAGSTQIPATANELDSVRPASFDSQSGN